MTHRPMTTAIRRAPRAAVRGGLAVASGIAPRSGEAD